VNRTDGFRIDRSFSRKRFVVSRLGGLSPGDRIAEEKDVGLIYLCRDARGATFWSADLEHPKLWKFPDRIDAELMLGHEAGMDITAEVEEVETA